MASSAKSHPALPTLKKTMSGSQSAKNQMSIAGFFIKQASSPSTSETASSKQPMLPAHGVPKTMKRNSSATVKQSLTPAPSSDAIDDSETLGTEPVVRIDADAVNGLPSPVTPAEVTEKTIQQDDRDRSGFAAFSSPSRKVLPCASLFLRNFANAENVGKEGRKLRRVRSRGRGR